MPNIWRAAGDGDVGEVERLVGQDPGLLNARDGDRWTPLMWASREGRWGVVRWLIGKGAALDEREDLCGCTALMWACFDGHTPVVRLLLEGGADPTIANHGGSTPLMTASSQEILETVRVLLGHPGARATVNRRNNDGRTALCVACFWGYGGIVNALLENGADPTIAANEGTTPMAIAKADPPAFITIEGRRECVAALEVRLLSSSLPPLACALLISWLRCCPWAWWQEAERTYQLWKARQVADQEGSGAVAVPRGRGGLEVKKTRRSWTGWCTASRGTCSRTSWR
jgi:uncharacterized protein